MKLPISNDTIDKIKDNINIVEVISEYVDLKPSGKNYKGLCPFHNEKTPSFVVNQEKGIFHCFGCGIGGNVFTFLMKLKGLSFLDAVKVLARKAGIPIYEGTKGEKDLSKRSNLYRINKLAAGFYRKLLFTNEGKKALDYLKNRTISIESIKSFILGFAPDGWDNLIRFMKKQSVEITDLEKVGLVVRKKNSEGYYDRFRNRIIFPIQDSIGRIIGFGGRTIENRNDVPKYLNTSDNDLFHKGKSLYGFYNAEQYIRKEGHVFIVEGYLDVITMHQSGIMNVVAPLGTALTEEHIDFITRYTKKIYLLFDPDEAGEKAALRGINLLHASGIDPFIGIFPSGVDPADFFSRYSIEEFKLLIKGSLTGVQFLVKYYTKNKSNYSAQEKLSIIEDISSYYKSITDNIIKDELINEIARNLSLEKSIVMEELNKFSKSMVKGSLDKVFSPREIDHKKSIVKKELYLLLLLLNNLDLFDIAYTRLESNHFIGKWTKRLWNIMTELYQNKSLDIPAVFNRFDDEGFISFISGKLMDDALFMNPKEQIIDLISYLKERLLKEKLDYLNKMIRKAELENDEEAVEGYLTEKQMYRNELKKVELLRSSKSMI
ncbi:MAG: DNA primase [Spirochaetes bacterium]|nr:MAG: DNA primase [Spirochaetota bacterium]